MPEKAPAPLPIESFHQKITVMPAEPKKCRFFPVCLMSLIAPHEIQESSSFINALATSQPVVRKKRKIPKVEAPAPIPETPMVSFLINVYCLQETDVGKAAVIEQMDTSEMGNKSSPTSDSDAPKKSSMASFTAFVTDKKPKKRVSWAPEDKLQDISYFEVDENERGMLCLIKSSKSSPFLVIIVFFV